MVLGTTSGTTKAGVHQQFQWQPSWLAPIVTSHAMARTHVISNKQASPTTLAKVSSPRAVAPSSKSSTKKEHAHALRAHRDRTCPFFDCFCSGLDNLLSLRSRSLRPSVNRRIYPADCSSPNRYPAIRPGWRGPNALRSTTSARVRHAARRRGCCVAGRRPCADARPHLENRCSRERILATAGGIAGRAARPRLCRRKDSCLRVSFLRKDTPSDFLRSRPSW